MISWHRFYDPSTGRYISADPIGLDGGINLYAYVGGDPVNAVDPKGLMEVIGLVYGYSELSYHKLKGHDDWVGNDYFDHCMMSCRGNSFALPVNTGGITSTNIYGAALEAIQTYNGWQFGNNQNGPGNTPITFDESKEIHWDRDIPSNMAGAECAENECESCFDCCSKYAKKRKQEEG